VFDVLFASFGRQVWANKTQKTTLTTIGAIITGNKLTASDSDSGSDSGSDSTCIT